METGRGETLVERPVLIGAEPLGQQDDHLERSWLSILPSGRNALWDKRGWEEGRLGVKLSRGGRLRIGAGVAAEVAA